MIKNLKLLLIVFLLLGFSNSVKAATVTFDFTADNKIQDWWIENSGSVTKLFRPPEYANWPVKSSWTLNLTGGETYDIIWQTYNTGGPKGFLGSISSDALFSGTVLSSNFWFVQEYDSSKNGLAAWNSSDWVTATTYGQNLSHITWGTIAGISSAAEWLWADVSSGDNIYVKTRFSLAPDPVPEPTAIFLLGFGLLGMAGIGRRKK